MSVFNKLTRRNILKSVFASLAGTAVAANPLLAGWKAPGETRVIFLVGDYWHNGVAQEKNWRSVLGPTGWNLLSAQSPQFVTKEALAMADSFVVARALLNIILAERKEFEKMDLLNPEVLYDE